MQIKTALLDARSSQEDWDLCASQMRDSLLVGIDCETQDEGRHAGLEVYNNGNRHVFDHRRTVMTGFSLYADDSDTAWYINLAHADVENRVTADKALKLIHAINPEAIRVAHQAAFELVMFKQCHEVDLAGLVCTLQMAVSHHGPDEYTTDAFNKAGLNGFMVIAKACEIAWSDYTGGNTMTGGQSEMLGKFISKESKAEHSYNGFVKSIAMGYNLKALTLSRFGVKQMTYKEVLAGRAHMGELTGDEVATYGADDAYWAVQHFKWMRDDLLANNPPAFIAFLKTENPMVQIYADSWRDGLRLDLEQVFERQRLERIEMAKCLRTLKEQMRVMLPFPDEPCEKLVQKQGEWYVGYDKKTGAPKNNYIKKRKQITDWCMSADQIDDFAECYLVSNPVGNAWAIEKGHTPRKDVLNLTHYMGMRVILHDLMDAKLVYEKGSVTTDATARGKMVDAFAKGENLPRLAIMTSMQKMADIEQRMKLYLTPYTQLMDPETSRVYPSLSSELATRRLAAAFPNPMQLAKQGESAYIRSFYKADDDESVVISADWSSIELVLVGDQSGDPAFAEVFGQLPYGDLHSGAAADCLAVKTLPGLTEAEFMEFKFGRNPNNRVLKHVFTGQDIDPTGFYKLTRGTPVGKGANFSYWFSGALSSVAQTLGWTDDEMWDAVDRYRQRFAVAEAWRVGKTQEISANGFVTLPDGHRRVRQEATGQWAEAMRRKFANVSASPAMQAYANFAIKRIQSRSRNQAVNAMIQGSCATLAKRSILTMAEKLKDAGLSKQDCRFMLPVHDELVYSANIEAAPYVIPILRESMCTHPEIVKTLPLSCSVAVGRTFRPYDKSNPAYSQIELDEAVPIPGLIGMELENQKLSDDKVAEVLEFIKHAKVAA